MSKIIYYDFQAKARHKEMEEIQMRILERLSSPHLSAYYNEEQRLQVKKDNTRWQELKHEEEEWKKLLKLNKKGKEK